LPAPATDKLVELPFPVRVACGSDEPVGGFVPDPNMVAGGMNHADVAVDTGVPHAAPAAVYQSECYGKDFAYTFPVPAGEHYLVRLHFAEIFDGGTGTRVENIAINGQPVLTNFDIFATAGGKYKAVVKEFPDVATDARGNIVIRITAAPDSPDQNAKISGIEILKQESGRQAGAQTASPAQFDIRTADGKCVVTINIVEAPGLENWAKDELGPALAEWYPKIVAMLPSEGFTAPEHFSIAIKPMDGVAYTTGTDVFASEKWIKNQIKGEAIGSLVHEVVHVVQQYGKHGYADHAPGWLVEGVADYIRWFKYEPGSHGADIVWMRSMRHFTPRYDGGYRVTANFLNWVSEKYDHDIVRQLNAAMREGKYDEGLWKEYTGKDIQELGVEWKKDIEPQLAAQSKGTVTPSKEN